jgi:exonuclease SbcD
MTIRILHTADNHLGLPFRNYPAEVRSELAAERFAALSRLVDEANERKADFFVVAGDLFDSPRMKVGDVEHAAAILRGFAGTAVLVLPGNHDHHSGTDSELWKRFRGETEGAAQVELLAAAEVKSYDLAGRQVHFFPCPCPSKTGREATIGWVTEAARRHPEGLRIGIAHGNVPGLGLDAGDQYFSMEPAALESAGMATWLLGHIHVPFPTNDSGTSSPYFMAGTHTPDSLRCRHAGSAWWIECAEYRVTHYERITPGRVRFARLERRLLGPDDIAALTRDCRDLQATPTILDLQLVGRLSAAERTELETAIEAMRSGFLAIGLENEGLRERIDAEQIAARYRGGGLAERLLLALLDDMEHPDAATLAHELIDEASKA